MDFETLDKLLEHQSYVGGHVPTQQDTRNFRAIKSEPPSNYPHLTRWYRHLSSFGPEVNSFPQDNNQAASMEEVVKGVSELSTTDNAVKTQKPAEQNKKAEQKQKKKDANKSGGAGAKEMNPWPEFIQERLNLWDKLKKEADEALAAKVPTPIKVTLPDGAVKEGESWRTTPFMIAQGISQGLAESTIVAKVNGDVWDLDRPLEDDCSLQLLKFTDDDAKTV
ncbi:unnamed protein product, partial [Meganyctiphanes norvegica]